MAPLGVTGFNVLLAEVFTMTTQDFMAKLPSYFLFVITEALSVPLHPLFKIEHLPMALVPSKPSVVVTDSESLQVLD